MQGSKIEWTDDTFNPWWGCIKIAPECDHCYANAFDHRIGGDHWGPVGPNVHNPDKPERHRRTFGDSHWRGPVLWNRRAEVAGCRRRVFCASMADVLEDLPELVAPRERLWNLVAETDWLDWLILTKRIENARWMLPWLTCICVDNLKKLELGYRADLSPPCPWHDRASRIPWGPWPNVWMGTSVGIRGRIWCAEQLRQTPAALRFLSCEPLLEDITADLAPLLRQDETPIRWVIAGGESGSGARPCDLDWLRRLRDVCAEHEVPFFLKQLGGPTIQLKRGGEAAVLDGVRHIAIPASPAMEA